MIKTLSLVSLILVSVSAYSAPAEHFYSCSGIADIEEYRVGINLRSQKAAFFDNDSTSYMELVETKISQDGQTVMIYEGPEAISPGSLKLYFYQAEKTVRLYTIDEKGISSELGTASCVNDKPWGDLE